MRSRTGAGPRTCCAARTTPPAPCTRAEELTAVAALADRYGVRVVADEIHAPVVARDAGFVPYLSVPGAENGLSLMSASKAWNLAGLKAALAVAGPAAADDLARIPEEVSHGPSHLGIIAHTAALRDGGDWLDAVLRRPRRQPPAARRTCWPSASPRSATAPPPGPISPGSTAARWASVTTPPRPSSHRGRVALSSGTSFGTGGAGHVRLNLATSPELLTEAVRRMAAALT